MNTRSIIALLGTVGLLFFAACEKSEKVVPVSSISINKTSVELVIGETVQLSATVSPSDATEKTVAWVSSNPGVASVENGKVTAIAEGSASITASAGGKSANCAITVSKKTIDVTSVVLNKTELSLTEGESETLVATVKPDDATDKTVTWSSSNETAATVIEGIVTAVAEGTATITAIAGEKSATCAVTVSKKTDPFLTFYSEGTTTICLKNNGNNAPVLYYSYDKINWTRWDYNALSISKESPLFLYGSNREAFSSSFDKYSTFTANGDCFAISGSIMSLLEKDLDITAIPSKYCFMSLFKGCSILTEAPMLPAIQLQDYCYCNMFYGCSSLKTAPELPAKTMVNSCYAGMFGDCISLSSAPELPAIYLDVYCYSEMFQNCISLTSAPVLPASSLAARCYSNMFSLCSSLSAAPELPVTELANGCYEGMFYGCSSLTTAPELPATTLTAFCYAGMFAGCTALENPPALPAISLEDQCYNTMFGGCTSLTSAPKLPATELAFMCYASMFANCKSLTKAPELPATTLAGSCYEGIFYSCTSLEIAPELPATTLASGCYRSMFNSCTSLKTAPELPASTLASSCYWEMFYGCSSLDNIKALFTTTPSDSYTRDWVSGVSVSGTFVKNADATWDVRGSNGIPEGWTVETATN